MCTSTIPIQMQEHIFRVFENNVLRIFHRQEFEVTGRLRELYNVELRNLNHLPNIVTVNKSSSTRRDI